MKKLAIIKNKPVKQFSKEDWKLLRELGIVNGFGPRNNPVIHFFIKKIAPDFNVASSEIHDVNYWKGGTEKDREKADEGFLYYILLDAIDMKGIKFLYYLTLSILFYASVRFFGKYYFNYK